MDNREERSSSVGSPRTISILLLFVLVCGGVTESRAAAANRPGPTSGRRSVQQPKSAPGALSAAVVVDPCMPPVATGQTKAMITERLWSGRISAPDSSDDVETSLALKRLIRQVHRMTLNEKNSTPPSAPAAEPASAKEPAAPPATMAEEVPVAPAEVTANPASETAPALSEKARKALADLQRNPSRVRDPLETAELLFLSGRPGDAAPFYEEALRRTSPGAATSADDRAWILFQLGNCLRETDAAKAQNFYAKLISEYPDSPWTEMARAGGRLLTWYQNVRPDQLVAPVR